MATEWKWVSASNQLNPKYWTAADPSQQERLNECVRTAADLSLDPHEAIIPLCDFLVEQIETFNIAVEAAYFALHDKDEPTEKNNVNPATGYGMPHLHYHIEASEAKTPADWSKMLGIRTNFIEPVHKGGTTAQRRSNSISYLIHIKYPEKYQYEPRIVYTARGTDYMTIYRDSKEAWERGKDVIQYEKAASRDNYTAAVMKIVNGEMTANDLLDTLEGRLLLHKYHSGIQEAEEIYKKSRANEVMCEIDSNQFTKTSLFIRGETGSGKSWFAKLIAKALCSRTGQLFQHPWSYYLAQASSDYLDEYAMQETIIFNDIEADTVGHEKWKHILEPHEINAVHSRYNNVAAASRVNLITNTQDIYEYWYYQRKRSMHESIDQLLRRIELLIDVVTLSDSDSEEPSNENTRVRIRKLRKLPKKDQIWFDAFPRSNDWTESFPSRYVYVVPEGLPEWLHPDDALEIVLKLIMENNKIPYALPPATLESIEASRDKAESYRVPAPLLLRLKPPEPEEQKELPAVEEDAEDADYEAEPVKSYDSLTLTGLSVKYSLNLNNLIGASGNPEINIFELKSYIDYFVEEEIRGETDPLRIDFNPFKHPEDLYDILLQMP